MSVRVRVSVIFNLKKGRRGKVPARTGVKAEYEQVMGGEKARLVLK